MEDVCRFCSWDLIELREYIDTFDKDALKDDCRFFPCKDILEKGGRLEIKCLLVPEEIPENCIGIGEPIPIRKDIGDVLKYLNNYLDIPSFC